MATQYTVDETLSLNGMCPVARKALIGDKLNDLSAELTAEGAARTAQAIVHVSQTITLAECQAALAGVKTVVKTTALPLHARLIATLYTLDYFDNAGDTAVVSLVTGGTTANGILNLADVSTGGGGASAVKIACTGAEAISFLDFGGQTITTTLTSDVDINTFANTKGDFTLDLFYVVLA